jgi:hypothetical protein
MRAHLARILADFLNCSDMRWKAYLQSSAQAETCTAEASQMSGHHCLKSAQGSLLHVMVNYR